MNSAVFLMDVCFLLALKIFFFWSYWSFTFCFFVFLVLFLKRKFHRLGGQSGEDLGEIGGGKQTIMKNIA